MFRLRKNLMMCVICDPTIIMAASTMDAETGASEWQGVLTGVNIEWNPEAKHGVGREPRNTGRADMH
jgi:hypothetical protein